MSFAAQVFRLFIASPSDMADERQIIREVVAEWNAAHAVTNATVILTVGWEMDAIPQLGSRPQQVINESLLRDCDLLIGVLGGRMGSDAGKGMTGTEEEIKEHLQAGKHAMVYFSNELSSLDTEQHAAVKQFRRRIETERLGLYGTFKDGSDFYRQFTKHLAIAVNKLREAMLTSKMPPSAAQSVSASLPAEKPRPLDGNKKHTVPFSARTKRMWSSETQPMDMQYSWNELLNILGPLMKVGQLTPVLKRELENKLVRDMIVQKLRGPAGDPWSHAEVSQGELLRILGHFEEHQYLTQDHVSATLTKLGKAALEKLSVS